MVGRLVEQQQVRRAHQCPGQAEPDAPAAGKFADLLTMLVGREAEPVEQVAGTGSGVETRGVIEFLMGMGDALAVARGIGRDQFGLGSAQAYITVEHEFQRRAVEIIDLLRHVGDDPVSRNRDAPGIHIDLAQQCGEQARLAGAVGPDHADFLARVNGQAGAFEQHFRATAQGDGIESDHERRRYSMGRTSGGRDRTITDHGG